MRDDLDVNAEKINKSLTCIEALHTKQWKNKLDGDIRVSPY